MAYYLNAAQLMLTFERFSPGVTARDIFKWAKRYRNPLPSKLCGDKITRRKIIRKFPYGESIRWFKAHLLKILAEEERSEALKNRERLAGAKEE